MSYSSKGDATRQRILSCAAEMFADKGFTETTIREIAKAAGLKNPASLYFHFASKYAILEDMLADYTNSTDLVENKDVYGILRDNSTLSGILSCYQTVFPEEKIEYYLKVLCVLLQEQLRNPIIRQFVSENVILRLERNTYIVLSALMELGVIRQDTDTDYWMKTISSLLYTFAARRMLGIGDNMPEFTGKSMDKMLECTISYMLEKCGAVRPGDSDG